ncbi:MAG: aminotransferase class V-fold PLP-dependent enzyme [Parcubacteria group bacterium]
MKSKRNIPLFWPSYNGRKIQKLVNKAFPADMSNRWLGQAHKVDEFEQEFGKKFGYKYCVAVSSGTASIELAYHLLDFKKGDEVITPVLTCTATNLHFARNGIKIKFADIKDDLTIDPDDVERKITPKTRAIVAVTLGGLPVDKKLFKIAKKHKIPVVIDAAQSLGVGEKHGEYICHSFQAIKHFTTGDGGMLVVKNKEDYKRAKKLRWFGIDREAKMRANWQPYKKRQMTMDIKEPGYKFQMNDVEAMMGLVGLQHSDEYLKHRKRITDYYDKNIKCATVSGGSCWLYGILVSDRDHVASELEKAGVDTNMAHLRNDIFTAFGGKREKLPKMNELESKYIYIPINTKMTMDDAKYVAKKLNEILKPQLV